MAGHLQREKKTTMTETKERKKTEDDTNGDKNITGWSKLALEVGRTFGVPTVLLLLISYWLLWQVTPPMVSMLQEFMKSTIETQAELAKTQADIAESQRQLVVLVKEVSAAAQQIVIAEASTQKFMERVEATHIEQMTILKNHTEKLDVIEDAVKSTPP
jgi:hypothetical protein